MPEDWSSKKHDRALLKYAAKNGLKSFGGPDVVFEETGKDAFPSIELNEFKEFLEKEAPELIQTYPQQGEEAAADEDQICSKTLSTLELLLFNRIQQICLIYKDFQQQSKILMKRPKTIVTPDGITTITAVQHN